MYNITSVIGIQGIFLKPRKCTRVCQLDVLLTGDGGVGGGERITDHPYGRCGPAAEEPKGSNHRAMETWEKVVP